TSVRFFFLAEGGIRDFHVTGVQTCALPISRIAAGANEDDLEWTRVLMKTLMECHGCTLYGNLPYQAVSFHYYTHSGSGINTEDATAFDENQFYDTMAYAADMERVIRGHVAVMDSYDPQNRVSLVCDE